MAEWRETTLDKVVELRRGFDLPHRERRDGSVPVLSAGSTAGWHDTVGVAGPGMVVGRATNLGRPTWSSVDFWPLNTTLFAADFQGNEPKWVFYLFESIDLSGFDSGSVQPMLNRNYIAKVRVRVPDPEIQRAIAAILTALDDKIVANTRLAATADDLARTVLASAEPSVPVSEIAAHSRLTVNPEGMTVPRVAHFSLPAFDVGTGPEIVDPESIKSNKFLVSEPAVLVSKLNPRFPRVWNLPSIPEEPALASTEFVVLVPTACSTTVLWALTSQPRFGAALEGMVAGTSGSHQRVKPAEMLATLVPDPRRLEPSLLAQVDALGARSLAAQAENVTLAATRNTLLPQLMSGKLRVREAAEMAGL